MSVASHKAIVRRYFEEALDKRRLDVLDEIVSGDCIIHRPEASEPIRGLEAFKNLSPFCALGNEFFRLLHRKSPPAVQPLGFRE